MKFEIFKIITKTCSKLEYVGLLKVLGNILKF